MQMEAARDEPARRRTLLLLACLGQASIQSYLLSLEKNVGPSLKGYLPQFESVIIFGNVIWSQITQ